MDIVTLIVLCVAVILLVLLFLRKSGDSSVVLEEQTSRTKQELERIERCLRDEIARNREEVGQNARQAREELSASVNAFAAETRSQMKDIADLQKSQLDSFSKQLLGLTQTNEQNGRASREEMRLSLNGFSENLVKQLQALTQSSGEKSDKMRETIEARLQTLQEDNSKKLEQMRATVDEKLHETLEERLGQSFKRVSDQLAAVHEGLGEMRSLASGVGDLKKVLTNVKSRGTWGEVQLGNILEQILTPEQFGKNVPTKPGSNDRVEYAVKLPGRDTSNGSVLWLPIDAKFPQEDYQRLIDAQEQANPVLAEDASNKLEARIKNEARSIREKYVDPPHTTDFGIMFLPTEGLFAEVIRRPGLADGLQRDYRVIVAGPTTLAALLNSLQMGFRTLAIEKRSSEVWALLGTVKTEFGRFGDILEKTQKKLHEASSTIEDAARKSRTIERRLKGVQELPAQQTLSLLSAEDTPDTDNHLSD